MSYPALTELPELYNIGTMLSVHDIEEFIVKEWPIGITDHLWARSELVSS